MSSDFAIRVENVSKVFHVYERPVDRLKQMLLPRVGKLVPGTSQSRWESSRYSREFWALRDVSFEVAKGDALGILGRNGSGKSTLLQIIAGTLTPTTGTAQVNGRVAALLELGSGFNPEFSGRENVILNGMILGLSQKEILERFDDIAAFADIGEFIDQPVKTYSSGMMLRLAFAVQTQIHPDILIVDEALSVGDALFQKRCYQQMERLRSEGCTLLFVSHDQESVRTLTSHALLLRDGITRSYGVSSEVVLEYRRQLHDDESAYFSSLAASAKVRIEHAAAEEKAVAQHAAEPLADVEVESDPAVPTDAPASHADERYSFGDMECHIDGVKVYNSAGEESSYFYPGDPIRITVDVAINQDIEGLNVNLRLRNKEGVKMYSWGTLNQDMTLEARGVAEGQVWTRRFRAGERLTVDFEFDCALGMNFYEVQASVSEEGDRYYTSQRMLHWQDEAAFFQVTVRPREYTFGGVADLRMRATPRS